MQHSIRRAPALVLVLALLAGALAVIPAVAARADGAPSITLTRTVAPTTLFGTAVGVTLTASNAAGNANGYNLSFTDVLPKGATFASGDAPTQQLAQADGTTVLVWSNVSDLLAGTTNAISYTYSYPTNNTSPFLMGANLSDTANAYVNSAPRSVPQFDGTGTVVAGSSTGSATSTSATQLVPYTVKKTLLNTPENEMLRGVHDHRYVYQIVITNNTATPTAIPELDDYLPADLEFLGCSAADNSRADLLEYSGATRIDATAFPAVTNCAPGGVQPVATTVAEDPDGSGPLLNAVYTKVAWTGIGTLAAGATETIQYVTGVPLRENVASPENATANLDNNTGALTTDNEPIVNYAVASGTNQGTAYSIGDYATASAQDVAVQKTVSTPTIEQGETSTWTLNVESSEYAVSTGPITVTDVVPSALDIASVGNNPTPQQTPNANGTTTLTWVLPGYTAKNGLTTLVYTTTTRTTYRGTSNPVAAQDSWTNNVNLSGTATDWTGFSTQGTVPVTDTSSATQQASGITISKKVLPAADTSSATCTGFAANTSQFVNDQSAAGDAPFHPGDTVCWLLTVSYPSQLNTLNTNVQDILPPGFVYQGYYATNANNATLSSTPPTSDVGTGTTESWGISNASSSNTFQVVVASKIADTTGSSPAGTIQGNLMKVSYQNTAGSTFQLRDLSNVLVSNPSLSIVKTASPTTASAGDTVTYTIAVTNSGTQAATAQVSDALPANLNCTTVSGVTGGTCTGSTITWGAVAVAASSSTNLTYTAVLPNNVGAGDGYVNTATVPSYTATTNTGGTYTYTPNPTPTSSATVGVPSPTVSKTGPSSLTIGQSGTFTITTTIPAKTSLYDSPVVTDAVPSGYAIDATSATIGGTSATPSVSGNTVTVPLTTSGTTYDNHAGAAVTVILSITVHLTDTSGNTRGTQLNNSASVAWTGESDTNRRTVTSNTVTTTDVEPNISLTKTDNANGQAAPGSTVTYTITTSNSGSSTAYGTVVTDAVPAQLIPLNSNGLAASNGQTVEGTLGGVWNSANGTITYTIPTIAAGSNSSGTFLARIQNPLTSNGQITNTVSAVTSSLPSTDPNVAFDRNGTKDPSASGYTATASDRLANPAIAMTKHASVSAATIGDDISYTITATVPASTVANNVTIRDTLPAGVTWASMTSTSCVQGGTTCSLTPTVVGTPQPSDTQVAYFLGDVTAQSLPQIVSITYVGRVNAGASAAPSAMTNTAQVLFDSPGTADYTPTSISQVDAHGYATDGNSATATVTFEQPVLSVAKAVSAIGGTGGHLGTTPPRAVPGNTVTYTVTVNNIGTWPAYAAAVNDALPSGVPCSWVTSLGGATCAAGATAGVLSWTVAGPIAAGGSQTLQYTVSIPTTVTSASFPGSAATLTNTVDVPHYYGEAAGPSDTTRYQDYTSDPTATAAVNLDLATLSGNITEDWDLSGSLTTGDPALAGIPVTVTYNGPNGDTETFQATTDASGNYSVTNLPFGSYTVTPSPAASLGLTPSWDADGGTLGTWSGTVPQSAATTGVDFGYKGTGSIGTTVWFDQNKNGTKDSTESGLAGVTVTLTPANGAPVRTTTTAADGTYSFGSLPAGSYTVAVTPPTGYSEVTDPDGTLDNQSAVTLPAGANNTSQNFGYAGVYSIGSLVWLDQNSNGTQDSGEPGIPGAGVTVTFTPTGSTTPSTFTTTTDANGHYSVGNLPPGTYTVSVNPSTLPAGATETHGLDGILPPNTTQATISTANVTDANFGYTATQSLGGTVWWDYNGDHIPGDGPALGGVGLTVTYYGPDGVPGGGDDITYHVTTAANGSWSIPNVPQGNYDVKVDASTVPAGFSATYDTDGSADGLGETHVTVNASGVTPTQNFGYAGTGSIGDLVFLDRDSNGVQSTTPGAEPGIAGVPLTLTTTVAGVQKQLTTTTTAGGAYDFPGLPAGSYTVAITVPTGYTAVSDLDGGDHSTSVAALTAGQNRTDVDFGLNGTGSLGDRVYLDENGDGTQEAGEPGIPNATVTVQWAGPDGSFATTADNGTFTTTTDSTGAWGVAGLPPGDYRVTVTGVPAGLTNTGDPDGGGDSTSLVTLAAGQSNLNQDFGYQGQASVGHTVWLDVDGSSTQDSSDPGLPGIQVTVRSAGADGLLNTADDIVVTTTTDASGHYSVTGLPGGPTVVSYNISGLPAGDVGESDLDGGTTNVTQFTLGATEAKTDVDYVVRGTSSLAGVVYDDKNGDGKRESGEGAVEGISVIATWTGPDGPVVLTTTTAADGTWSFPNIPAGSYSVRLDPATFPDGFHSSTAATVVVTVPAGGVGSAIFGITTHALAATGLTLLPWLGIALLLLLAGAAAVIIARRRRPDAS